MIAAFNRLSFRLWFNNIRACVCLGSSGATSTGGCDKGDFTVTAPFVTASACKNSEFRVTKIQGRVFAGS